MLTISNICKSTSIRSYLLLQARHKNKIHWAKLKKKNSPKYKAMNLFDDFYGSIFGNQWESIKEGLLRRSKYAAVINNYGDPEETMEYLTNRGAHCLRNLIKVQKDFQNQYEPEPKQTEPPDHTNKLQAFAEKLHSDEISNIYPQNGNMPEKLDYSEDKLDTDKVKVKEKINVGSKTLDQSLAEAEIDTSRIIDPSLGLASEALYQFLPATKLKGMDEWIPESTHYSYYSTNTDFPLAIEPESELVYPEHLKVFTYEMHSDWDDFPEPKRCQTGVYNYYPLDCGSVLAVLALGLQAGDRVLDLCSAPGGKALIALQTLLPDIIICNDVSISRSNRTKKIFKDYLFDFETSNKWSERVMFKRVDGRVFTDDYGFDKVLVDVPCTTDRHSVNVDENNIFRPDRIKERLKIPEMQSALLTNALRLVKVGGTVVYSTCSLSPVQNDGVVHLSLKHAFESHGIVATVKDMTSSFSGFSSTLKLGAGSAAPKYGQLVLPDVAANFGPTYIAKLVRVK
ncbi:5-methylcytosine rRNA methyltransferase NSUN4 [Manduca sexta]|uniref:NOL1/NOP2/Sun domain family member 4 n=1 Tax=Manduca sexta TaxID=7130 RepID=A0A921YXW4_MANSE|nr:5-methylcytosine rRNA methyltransferase NSUN4 [Manduca sexta]KAG6447672.1 hypothetical protein O3G_MSEX005082 [Manduca sexta]